MNHTEPTNISPTREATKFAGSILDEETAECVDYSHLIKHPRYKDTWSHSFGNKIRWLVQGMPCKVKGTNAIFFINKQMSPKMGREMSHTDASYVTAKKTKVNQT